MSERSYLHDLSPEQAERLRLIRAGLPIPSHLEAVKGSGGSPAYNKLRQPKPLRTDRSPDFDKRRVHMSDVDWSNFVECGLIQRVVDGIEKLRVTDDWYKVTCLRCLTYWKDGDVRTASDSDGPRGD